MTSSLQGRRILVTGGATGIGAAAVDVLTHAGAHVVATYHQTPPTERAGVSWLQCDVRESAAVDAMVGEAAQILGGLDVLLRASGRRGQLPEVKRHAPRKDHHAMTIAHDTEVYYDPYDIDIVTNPYPVYARLREEAPQYLTNGAISGRSPGTPMWRRRWATGRPSPTAEATSLNW